ncbi:hypothetical protein I316_01922 [Kwoniella heveanensis BCC8398]|uniref:NADH:flavin oxidoreductase/NADH oxidase N-terminal domain-containing protein n=1 Tax=Kwoniella heveanensis BCC8398 TaxID=1296120 RepID=A0A1B9GYG5_9TREE|nr:hypothetical protein I316_01922 [Kwoniella heveanensis BCC8398]
MTIQTLDAWTPFRMGDIELSHRVVLAPLTRNRATKSDKYPSTWVPNDLMKEYYEQRATPGGLLITEATPVSLRASGYPGVPGWFTPEQPSAWIPIIDSVHAKGGYIFAQLWHQGRTTHSMYSGHQPESASATPVEGNLRIKNAEMDQKEVAYETPKEMTVEDIQRTQEEFVSAALKAREVGFDGIEIHAGNGYLFDQFHHSNINTRTDQYGGSFPNRCRFTLETVTKLCSAIGANKVAVRLTPFGLFNQTFGEKRVEQWTYLCEELSKFGLAYVHMVEPRFDEFKSAAEKQSFLEAISLQPFREVLGSTPLMVAGGYGPDNLHEGIQKGEHDLVAFGRYYTANPDLVSRLKSGEPLYKWDRSRFYGPFEDNEIGYTVFPKREYASDQDRLKAQLAD